jgi:diguanylate cyclase (GGDEF)-like protein/PAS domain S-box-containing protein
MRQQVLIIDDSRDTHVLVKARLAGEPIDLLNAETGIAGIELARSARPDLILLDVDMPEPDGFEVCRRLKKDPITREIPLIFLTGVSSTEQKLKGLELGAIDYITKPFDPAELRARVRASLRTKQLLDLLSEKATILQVSEERFRFLAENSNDIISRHNLRGEVLYVSPACRTILGYDPTDLVGVRAHHLIHDEDVALVTRAFGKRGPRDPSLVFRARRSDGTFVWLEATSQPIKNSETGDIFEIQMSSRDVTLRKHQDIFEQGRARVLEMVAESRPLHAILRELVLLVERMYCSAFGSAVFLSEGRLEHAAPSLPERFRARLDERLLTYTAQLCGDEAYEKQSVVCSDIARSPHWESLRDAAAADRLQTCWSTLIRSSDGDVRGMFAVYHREKVEPDRSAVELLEMVGKLITIASEHRDLAYQLAHRAQHDWLTGLPNRLLFEDRLSQGLAVAGRNGQMLALFCIDLDRFKHINDTLGHYAGDSLLVAFSRRIQEAMRESDTLARMGGDEFTLILPECKEAACAATVAQKLIDALKVPFEVAGTELFVTSSIGIAVYPKDGQDAATLQKNADVALYRAKALGRNRFQCFSADMLSTGLDRLGVESLLRRAVEKRELELHYQPQFDARGLLIGFEALMRWRNPTLGLMPPAAFIPLAEENGLIVEIGQWALDEACRQNKAWQQAGYAPVKVAVNVSALQFAQAGFADLVARALDRHQLEARWLELEITETLLMKNPADTAPKLRSIRASGVTVALDDFGTGYSSLAYLQQLPIDTLKIDRSFVQQIEPGLGRSNSTTVIRAILSLGRSLGMDVVAEGVEHEHQLEFLRQNGCKAVQGFLCGRPDVAAEAAKLLSNLGLRQSA